MILVADVRPASGAGSKIYVLGGSVNSRQMSEKLV